MGCAHETVRLFVFAVNLVFALAGLILVIVGTLHKLNLDDYSKGIPEEYQNIQLASTLTIALGTIIFLIAFFGCCGAVRESTSLLTIYSVILLIIFLCQIALGIYAFLEIQDKDTFRSKVEGAVKDAFNAYNKNNATREFVDFIQAELECCGTTGPNYWPQIPSSCYKDKRLFQEGCVNQFYKFLVDTVRIIGIIVLSLSAVEIVGAVLSLCLSNSIKNRERRFRY